MEQGPETVRQFVEITEEIGGSFDPDNFYVLHGEYDWLAVLEFPDNETASKLSDIYARTGRGRIHTERAVTRGPDGYVEYVQDLAQ